MLQKRYPFPVKFVCCFLYQKEASYAKSKSSLIRKFGKIDFESLALPFEFTHYYDNELGSPLLRRFIAFKKLYDPGVFAPIKTFCIALEKRLSTLNVRSVNIDPGYLNEAKFVLTTTKDYSHRIYLGQGIFAEVTLNYKGKKYQDLPTTYPDYRSPEYKKILLSIRHIYRSQIKPLSKAKKS